MTGSRSLQEQFQLGAKKIPSSKKQPQSRKTYPGFPPIRPAPIPNQQEEWEENIVRPRDLDHHPIKNPALSCKVVDATENPFIPTHYSLTIGKRMMKFL